MAVRGDASGDQALYDAGAPPSGAFTAMIWFRAVADQSNYATLFWFGADTAAAESSIAVYINQTSTDVLEVWALDAEGVRIVGTTTISLDTWYHVALVGNTGQNESTTLYLNGVSEGTGSTGMGTYSADRVQLGNDPFGLWLDGRLANWQLFNAELTQNEIASSMRRTVPYRFANLWQWARLLGSSDLNDRSVNGRNFTGTGLTTEAGPGIPWRRAPRRAAFPAAAPPAGDAVPVCWNQYRRRRVR